MSKYLKVIVKDHDSYYNEVSKGKPLDTIDFEDRRLYLGFKDFLDKLDKDDLYAHLIRSYLNWKGLGGYNSKEDMFYEASIASKSGDPRALTILGTCFFYGYYVRKILPEAINYYKQAAEKKYANALYNLYQIYKRDGDDDLAFSYLEKSALTDDPTSMLTLADLYFGGYLTNIDYKKAIYWYERALSLDESYAENNLAHCYQEGLGTAVNINRALEVLTLASKHGSVDALYNLGILYYNQNDYKTALFFLEEASMKYHQEATHLLTKIYLNGLIYPINPDDFYHASKEKANMGNTAAMVNLAKCYLIGIGTYIDTTTAKKWLELSAKEGNIEAIYFLETLLIWWIYKNITRGT